MSQAWTKIIPCDTMPCWSIFSIKFLFDKRWYVFIKIGKDHSLVRQNNCIVLHFVRHIRSLNNSFPPYCPQKEKSKKEILTKFPKRTGNFTSLKTVTTPDSRWGSKNLIQNNGSGNFPIFNSLRGSKGLVNTQMKSDTNLWTKQKNNIGSETEKLFFQRAPRKLP